MAEDLKKMYRTVMEDNQEGLFFEPCDPDKLADKMIRLLNDKKLMAQLGENGRRKALRYDWPIVTQQVLDYYREALNKTS